MVKKASAQLCAHTHLVHGQRPAAAPLTPSPSAAAAALVMVMVIVVIGGGGELGRRVGVRRLEGEARRGGGAGLDAAAGGVGEEGGRRGIGIGGEGVGLLLLLGGACREPICFVSII